ncbi:MAG: DUF2726 domain-containing protein [Thermus sp.]|nr:DUF2726 domain-containing protein [Thermus sp.]
MEFLFFILILIGLALLALSLWSKQKGSSNEEIPLPYRLSPAVLTPAERSFFEVLERAVPEGVRVWPKVRLVDFLTIEARGGSYQAALNRVMAKHVDFLLVQAQDTKPLLAIELDDRSHDRDARRKRDRFLEALAQKVGLPLVRVQVRKEGYPLEEVRRLVEVNLKQASTTLPWRKPGWGPR